MTVIYLIRHSKATKNSFYVRFSNRLAKNKNLKLDNEGIEIAKNALNNPLFDDVDNIYSSDYNRAKQTANFLAKRLNKNITLDQRLGERIHGNEAIPNDFEEKQMNNINYKLKGGESQKEVRSRMLDVLNQILEKHNDKKIAIFTHSTAISFMLKEWCDVKYCDEYKFNNNVFVMLNKYCGYRFKDEEKSQDFIKEQYKKENETLLEDVIESLFICNILYKKGIYTVNQLKNSQINLNELPGIGKERKKEVKKILEDLNLSIEIKIKEDNSFEENCKIIEKIFSLLKNSNEQQQKKLELLEKEYNELLEEKIILTEKELQLDKAIKEKKEEKNNGKSKRKIR